MKILGSFHSACKELKASLFKALTFWHRSFTFNSNKLPTWYNNFSVYYSHVCLQLNMFRAFSRPSSGAQWLQWQPLVLSSYRGDSHAVFVVGPAGFPLTLGICRPNERSSVSHKIERSAEQGNGCIRRDETLCKCYILSIVMTLSSHWSKMFWHFITEFLN
jgi:hypothetical protein